MAAGQGNLPGVFRRGVAKLTMIWTSGLIGWKVVLGLVGLLSNVSTLNRNSNWFLRTVLDINKNISSFLNLKVFHMCSTDSYTTF